MRNQYYGADFSTKNLQNIKEKCEEQKKNINKSEYPNRSLGNQNIFICSLTQTTKAKNKMETFIAQLGNCKH